jgi:hypothetical protein
VAACRRLVAEPLPAVAGFAAAEEAAVAVAVVQDARSPAPLDVAEAEEVGAAAPGALSQVPVLLPAVAMPDAPWSVTVPARRCCAPGAAAATVSPCSAAADR